MALTSDQITAQNFKDFYDTILPYLNGNNEVKSDTFSGTTDSNGLIILNNSSGRNVLSAYSNNNNHTVVLGKNASGTIGCIKTISTMANVASTAVSGTYYYTE